MDGHISIRVQPNILPLPYSPTTDRSFLSRIFFFSLLGNMTQTKKFRTSLLPQRYRSLIFFLKSFQMPRIEPLLFKVAHLPNEKLGMIDKKDWFLLAQF